MSDLPEETPAQSAATLPDEPFACPHCGQMLAPSVRVCPSCKNDIDPDDIPRHEVVIPIATQVVPLPVKEHARFSWGIFFTTLGVWMVVGVITETALGSEIGQFVLGGLVILSSFWVYRDAREKNIPKPFRWGLGSFLLWIIVFPWYLSRRKAPKADCPFIEGEGGRVARTLLFVLLIFILLSALMMLLKSPSKNSPGNQPASNGTSVPGGKIAAVTPPSTRPLPKHPAWPI